MNYGGLARNFIFVLNFQLHKLLTLYYSRDILTAIIFIIIIIIFVCITASASCWLWFSNDLVISSDGLKWPVKVAFLWPRLEAKGVN